QKTRNTDAPSTRAASMSSYGSASLRYCVIQKTPKAATRLGTIKAVRVSNQPKSLIMMNIGTVPSCIGMIIVAMTNTYRPVRARNVSVANAKPASVEKNTVAAETTTATTSEFMNDIQKSIW